MPIWSWSRISWGFPSRRLATLPAASSPRPLSRSSTPSLSKTSFARSSGRSLQAFGHRLVYFLIRIAFSAEQAKLLITNVLKFVLKLAGIDQKTYVTLVDESAKLAKRNILPTPRNSKTSWRNGKQSERKEGKRP